jgi:glycerophosphoryl diester phosphodiesterase
VSAAGCVGLFPPNTLLGVAAAITRGADVVEIDVVQSLEGELVAHHHLRLDPDRDRDDRGRWFEPPTPPVRSLTIAELGRIDVGRGRPGSRFQTYMPDMQTVDGARIPRVEEVIEIVALNQDNAPVGLDLELKTDLQDPQATPDPEAFTDAVAGLYRRHGGRLAMLASSFDWPLLRLLHGKAPDLPLCFLADERLTERVAGRFDALFAQVAEAGGETIGLHAGDAGVHAVGLAHAAGLRVMIWGPVDPFDPAPFIEAGVDAIVSLRPDLMAPIIARIVR